MTQNKKIIIIAIIVLIALGAVWYFNSFTSTGTDKSAINPNNVAPAPDLTTADGTFSEIDSITNALE
jgi:flagellar basal body-associated protein FliL